jgi:hypothetical protein
MADMFPDPDKVADQTAYPRHLSVPCPTCDRLTLYESADGPSDVHCLSAPCRAIFSRIEIGAERPGEGRIHMPIVYYMRMDRLVKIGTTTNLALRVETIGPQGVLAVEDGDRQVESQRHQQFVASHSHREWFHISAELGQHIGDLREAWEARYGQTVEEWLSCYGVRV